MAALVVRGPRVCALVGAARLRTEAPHEKGEATVDRERRHIRLCRYAVIEGASHRVQPGPTAPVIERRAAEPEGEAQQQEAIGQRQELAVAVDVDQGETSKRWPNTPKSTPSTPFQITTKSPSRSVATAARAWTPAVLVLT